MVKAITHWDSLLSGHPFVVETDHKSLCFLYKSDNPKVDELCAGVQDCRNMLSKCTMLQELTIQSPMLSVGYTQFKLPLPAQSMRCK